MDSLLLVYLIITLSITISQKVIMMGNNNRETISMSRVKLNGEEYMRFCEAIFHNSITVIYCI